MPVHIGKMPANVFKTKQIVIELRIAGPDSEAIDLQVERLKERIDHIVPSTVMRSVYKRDCKILDRKVMIHTPSQRLGG